MPLNRAGGMDGAGTRWWLGFLLPIMVASCAFGQKGGGCRGISVSALLEKPGAGGCECLEPALKNYPTPLEFEDAFALGEMARAATGSCLRDGLTGLANRRDIKQTVRAAIAISFPDSLLAKTGFFGGIDKDFKTIVLFLRKRSSEEEVVAALNAAPNPEVVFFLQAAARLHLKESLPVLPKIDLGRYSGKQRQSEGGYSDRELIQMEIDAVYGALNEGK